MNMKNALFFFAVAGTLIPSNAQAASSYQRDRNPSAIEGTLACGCVERTGTIVDTFGSRHRSQLMDDSIIKYCAEHTPKHSSDTTLPTRAVSTASSTAEVDIAQEVFNQIFKFETEKRPTATSEDIVNFRAELSKKFLFSLSLQDHSSIKKLLFEYDQEHCSRDYTDPLFADYFTGAMPRLFADWHLKLLQTTIHPLVEGSEQFLIKEISGDQISYDLFIKTTEECIWYIIRIGVSGATQKMLSMGLPLSLSDFIQQINLKKKGAE